MLKEVFGSENPSTSEIKKMKVDKLLKLAQYLDYSLPSPTQKQDVKEAGEYIVKNVWRLQGLWDELCNFLKQRFLELKGRSLQGLKNTRSS